jgi:hypothetical protein
MAGLDVPDRRYVGNFRGEPGLETVGVRIGRHEGVPPSEVAAALAAFERKLQRAVEILDAKYAQGQALDEEGLESVIDLSAWAHAEWVRIHPFGNGNGRTARIWAKWIFMRYGVPPVVRLRPRPDGGYGRAGAAAMIVAELEGELLSSDDHRKAVTRIGEPGQRLTGLEDVPTNGDVVSLCDEFGSHVLASVY